MCQAGVMARDYTVKSHHAYPHGADSLTELHKSHQHVCLPCVSDEGKQQGQ